MAQNTGLQRVQAVVAQRILDMATVLGDHVGKPLDPVGLVCFSFDQEARPRLLERHPTGRTHQDVGAKGLVQLVQCRTQVKLQRLLYGLGTADQGGELWYAGKIVVDTPAPYP